VVSSPLREARRVALKVVLGQLLMTLAVATVTLAAFGARAAYSALLGGGIGTAATLALALIAFGRLGAGSAERMLLAFYLGELLKLTIVIATFVVVLRWLRISPPALLAAYGATFLVYWIVLARLLLRQRAAAGPDLMMRGPPSAPNTR
jgi:ATP synthase protein I